MCEHIAAFDACFGEIELAVNADSEASATAPIVREGVRVISERVAPRREFEVVMD